MTAGFNHWWRGSSTPRVLVFFSLTASQAYGKTAWTFKIFGRSVRRDMLCLFRGVGLLGESLEQSFQASHALAQASDIPAHSVLPRKDDGSEGNSRGDDSDQFWCHGAIILN